jgi:hypothetical protein
MTIGGFMVVVKLRAAIRQQYDIPTGPLGRCEDLVCVCCCHCCVMSQMARQTADYDGDEPASCCSMNGIQTVKTKRHDDDDDDYDDDDDDDHYDDVIDDEDMLLSPIALRLSSSSFSDSSTSSHSTASC